MEKYKIAFFAEILIDNFDGASRTMFQLINRIPRDEFEFMFFCAVPPKKDIGFEVVVVPALKIPFNETYKIGVPFFVKKRIHKKLDEFQPDVIHFASPTPLASLAKKYANENYIQSIGIYHTHFISYIKYYFRQVPFLIPFFFKIASRLTKKYYDNTDKVYVPTQAVIDDMRELCGIKNPNLQLWPRGIDTTIFNPARKSKPCIKNITNNNHPTILFSSRLVWEKNLQLLIDLYKLYESKNIPVNFVVAGDGVARKAVERQMPNAHFLGMLDHARLAVVYASSDVYFFPSDTETFGNVVIEAMASGLPCVVADGGGPKSFVNNGVNGFLCSPNDVTAYFEKIQQLLNDPKLYQSFVEEGLKTTKAMDWDELSKIYFRDLKILSRSKIISLSKTKQLRKIK